MVRARPGQIQAMRHLWDAPPGGAALFLPVGQGKTASVLWALEEQHLPLLVIAPAKVAQYTWGEEIAKYRPDLTFEWAGPTPAKRLAALEGTADVVAVSMDSLWDRKRKAAVPTDRFAHVVIDEAQGWVSSTRTERYRATRHILGLVGKGRRKDVWLLTGTPTPMGLENLYPLMRLMDDDALGKTQAEFRQRYYNEYRDQMFVKGRPVSIPRFELRDGSREQIWDAVAERCLSQDRVPLPPLTQNIIDVPIPVDVQEIIENLRKGGAHKFSDGTALTSASKGVAAMQFLQVANGAVKMNEEEVQLGAPPVVELNTEKLDRLEMLIDSLGGDPLIVVYAFREDRRRIIDRFGAATIETPDWKELWDAGQIPVLTTHHQSIGAGLNLQTGGANLCWYTPVFSAGADEQMVGRLNRPGQTRPVTVHRLETKIDRLARESMEERADAQEALMEFLRRVAR